MAENYTYYFSDPDSADKKMHCLAINLPVDLTGNLPWHWHTKKPDESLKDPVWSVQANDFVENDKNSQAAILAEAQEKIDKLDQTQKTFDQDVQSVKEAQTAASQQQTMVLQQSVGLAKTINGLAKAQQANTQMMSAMQKLLLNIQQKVNAGSTTTDNKTGGNK